jgi:hypothetical protein
MRFKDYIKICESVLDAPLGLVIPNTNLSGAVSPIWNGGDINDPNLIMGAELELPTVRKEARIKFINDKINPILVLLADGTRLFFPFDAFRRIQGEPKVGKTMQVVFLRRNDDGSNIPSQVKSCKCY